MWLQAIRIMRWWSSSLLRPWLALLRSLLMKKWRVGLRALGGVVLLVCVLWYGLHISEWEYLNPTNGSKHIDVPLALTCITALGVACIVLSIRLEK